MFFTAACGVAARRPCDTSVKLQHAYLCASTTYHTPVHAVDAGLQLLLITIPLPGCLHSVGVISAMIIPGMYLQNTSVCGNVKGGTASIRIVVIDFILAPTDVLYNSTDEGTEVHALGCTEFNAPDFTTVRKVVEGQAYGLRVCEDDPLQPFSITVVVNSQFCYGVQYAMLQVCWQRAVLHTSLALSQFLQLELLGSYLGVTQASLASAAYVVNATPS